MPKIILSEFVEPGLVAIWDFIAVDSIGAADRFTESAHRTFQELARMPNMGRLREFRHARLQNLRSFRVKGFNNFLIFYCPLPDGIEVLHVLHGARDLDEFWELES